MANPEHLAILKQGVEVWNRWREEHPEIQPDLRWAHLGGSHLREAHIGRAYLSYADLVEADLYGANLHGTDPRGANLYRARLFEAVLSQALLCEAELSEAWLFETVFGDTDLSDAKGLDSCYHYGPSTLDERTLAKAGKLPLEFLRGCSLSTGPQRHSVFISCSHQDEVFTKRLHADLQDKDVPCWYAPEDIKISDRICDTIDQQIRLREKLLVVLSSTSIESEGVEDEVEAALEEERKSPDRRAVLFPIRIDTTIDETDRAWARKIKRTRHIGDFTQWKDHDAYQKAFERLLQDLKADDVKTD